MPVRTRLGKHSCVEMHGEDANESNNNLQKTISGAASRNKNSNALFDNDHGNGKDSDKDATAS